MGDYIVRVRQTRAVVNELDKISATRYGVAMLFDRQSNNTKVKGLKSPSSLIDDLVAMISERYRWCVLFCSPKDYEGTGAAHRQ